MNKITLAILVLLVILAPLSISSAQGPAAPDYSGSVIGGGIGFHSSATYWYWYNSTAPSGSREHWPIHVYSRTILSGFYEKRSLLTMGKIAGNLKIEGLLGFMGGTKEDWLPFNETISDGGISYGVNLSMKFAYPTELSPTMPVAPYAGIGLQYIGFNNNGSGVGTDFANDADYDYSSGWSEWIFALPVISFGVDFDFGGNLVISPEYRFLVAGSASSDWEPVGYAPEFDDVTYAAFTISIGKKF